MPDVFYSDRLNGPRPRDQEELTPGTVYGLVSLLTTKLESNWFAHEFPEHCPDGQGVTGTNLERFVANFKALVPDASWPLTESLEDVLDEVLFDSIEYAYQRIAKPRELKWHPFFNHHELAFDRNAGPEEFRSEVNKMLQRGGAMYKLGTRGEVQRLGSPIVQYVISRLLPASGDSKLDALLSEATDKYTSHRVSDRAVAVERLWDAFERLKTIDVPKRDKKAGIEALLGNIPDPKWRDVVDSEMRSLTDIGNDFSIRHFESWVAVLPEDAGDYLFGRMGSLLLHLLQMSNRLATTYGK